MQKQAATILSAELTGFQTLAENLSPKEIAPLMSELHALIENTIRLHQGNINRFAGDTFLAVFYMDKAGSPTSINAADAVFELKDRLGSLAQEKKLPATFELKVGIASGNIISGDIGSGDKKQETVMGETVTRALRICQFADEGQILVDENTHEASKDNFEFQSLEPIPLKGGIESLAIYEVVKKKRKKLNLKTSSERKIVSEMVGRSREAEQLEGLVKNLIAGKGSVVNIVGKAGIGKSRFMAEMMVQKEIVENVVLLEGGAMSTGQNLSYHPIIQLIKCWVGISKDDTPSTESEKLHKGIKQIALEQADDIYAFLATMMGLPLSGKYKDRVMGIEGEALEKLILKNLRDLIITAAKDKPRIYIIEDMHWSDNSSITIFESLFKLSQKHPVMFINVMRPGYKETGDYILKYLVDKLPGDHTTINVNPLNESDSVQLIGNLLRNAILPSEIEKMIISKTEGNPFFIEEVIRSFIDDGILDVQDKKFIVTEKVKEINIPDTINEAILSRVDKLDEKTRELLKTASVMGRNFYYKVLEEATDTIEELDERLAYLAEVQLISESKKKQEIEYLFKHALAQQLTYDSIMLQSRKELHNKIAHSIEKVFANNINEYFGTLAYHYENAENKEKTEEYLIKAGNEAIKSGASPDAINFFKKALKLYLELAGANIDNNKLRDIYFKLSIAYHSRGMSNEALEALDKTLALYGYKIPKNKVRLMLGFLYGFFHLIFVSKNEKLFFKKSPDKEMDMVMTLIYYRVQVLSTISPKRALIECLYFSRLVTRINLSKSDPTLSVFIGFSLFFFWTGISLKISGEIIKIGEKFLNKNYTQVYIKYRYLKKMHNYHCGIIEKDKDLDLIYKTAVDKGMDWGASYILFFNGFCHGDSGDRKMCDYITERLKLIADQFKNPQLHSSYYRFLAYVDIKYRELNRSTDLLKEGAELIRKTEHNTLFAVICSNLSILNTLNGKLEEAKKYIEEAEQFIEIIKVAKPFYGPYLLAKVNYEFAIMRSPDSNDQSNKKVLEQALKELIKTARKFRGILPESLLLYAQVNIFLKKQKKAFKSLKEACNLTEKFGGKVDQSRIYFELGKFLSNPKNKRKQLNGLSGKDYLEKARAMFEEMDLQWDLGEYGKFVEK